MTQLKLLLQTKKLDFYKASEIGLKRKKRISKESWIEGCYLLIVDGSSLGKSILSKYKIDKSKIKPFIILVRENSDVICGYDLRQEDINSNDWFIIED